MRFEREAARWDESPRRVALARAVADAILQDVPLTGSEVVLDYGCGTGLLALALRPHVRRMIGVDTSPAMLAQFEAKLSDRPDPDVALHRLEGEGFLRSLGPVDLLVSSMTLHHVLDLDTLFKDVHALVRPGGRIAMADLDAEDGTFHDDPEGVVHQGFQRDVLAQRLLEAGFRAPRFRTVTEIPKNDRIYPVFLVTAHR